jgi:phage protein U
MICLLGDFEFDIKDTESIKRILNVSYSKHERIGNNPKFFEVGKWDEQISFTATFRQKHREHMKIYEEGAKDKKPIWLVFPTGESIRVLVVKVEFNRSLFDAAGSPVMQEAKFSLEVFYE